MTLSKNGHQLTSSLFYLSSALLLLNSAGLMEQLPHFSQSSQLIISASSQDLLPPPMLKLERLMLAMAEHEGWFYPKEQGYAIGSKSYRNNNPGNLRASPFSISIQDGFAVFKTEADGWAGFKWDLIQKAKGNTTTGLGPNSTIRDLIHKWAPVSDGNQPNLYLVHVLQMTGFPETMTLREFL